MRRTVRKETDRFIVEARGHVVQQGIGALSLVKQRQALWSGDLPPLSYGDDLAHNALEQAKTSWPGSVEEVVLLRRTYLTPSLGGRAVYSEVSQLPSEIPVTNLVSLRTQPVESGPLQLPAV